MIDEMILKLKYNPSNSMLKVLMALKQHNIDFRCICNNEGDCHLTTEHLTIRDSVLHKEMIFLTDKREEHPEYYTVDKLIQVIAKHEN